MQTTTKKPSATGGQKNNEEKIKYSDFPLAKLNFVLMAVCGVMIVAGFLLMLGSGNTLDHYNGDMFSTRRLVVGPTLAILGFVAMALAIIYKKKQ